MGRQLLDFVREERGQDLIEYALLTAFIALAGLAGFNAISNAMGASYTTGNTAVQDLWEVPPPPAPPAP